MHKCPCIVSFKALVYEQLLFDKRLKLLKHNVTLQSEERGPPCGVTV